MDGLFGGEKRALRVDGEGATDGDADSGRAEELEAWYRGLAMSTRAGAKAEQLSPDEPPNNRRQR